MSSNALAMCDPANGVDMEPRLAAIVATGEIDLLTAAGLAGDDATDDATKFATYLTSLGSAVTRLRVRKKHMLRSAVSVPSTIDLIFTPGAGFDSDNASQLTVRSGITAGRYRCFFGSLAVRFVGPGDVGLVTSMNRPDVYPEWWGANPYLRGSPVDVTAGFAAMHTAMTPIYSSPGTPAGGSAWAPVNVSLQAGPYRVSAGVGAAALSPPASMRGYTMKGAGIQRTFIECADGAGVAKATPAMAMLDLNGQFFARLQNFSIGGVATKGNYSYGIYYHRNANTSALGSSQLEVDCVEVTDPWIVAAWRFGSDTTYDPNVTSQCDNVVTHRMMAHRNSGYANDGYCQYGVKQGVGFTTNTLNFSHDGMDILGCGVGLFNSATNGRVTNWEMGANDIDFSINQNTVAYFSVDGGRSESSRKAIDATASNWTYSSSVSFRNCLWHLNKLANDPIDGTPDWAKLAATGDWLLENIEVSAILNQSLQPTLRLYNDSVSGFTVRLNGVRVQLASRASWLAYDAAQVETYSAIRVERLDFIDVNDNVVDSIGMEGPTQLGKPGTVYGRRLGHWFGEGNDALGPDCGYGRWNYGVAGSPNFMAHTLSVQTITASLQQPHVTTTDAAGGTNYLVAFVGYDGASPANHSLKGTNSTSIQCVAEASLSATHCLTVTLEDAQTPPIKGHALALTYDIIYSADGGTTWKLAKSRIPYATFHLVPFKITTAGTAYTLPTVDTTGNVTYGQCLTGPALFNAGNLSGAITLDYRNGGSQKGTLTGNVTSLTVSNVPDGNDFMLQLTQDATGSRTVAGGEWINGNFPGGTAATVTPTAGKIDRYLRSVDGSTVTWTVVSQNR